MKKNDFNYNLPPQSIAQNPSVPRDFARLLMYERSTRRVFHRIVRDLPHILGQNDVLVFNNSAVFPARLHGVLNGQKSEAVDHGRDGRISLHVKAEMLLLRQISENDDRVLWSVMVKPGRRFSVGKLFEVCPGFQARVESIIHDDFKYYGGNRIVSFSKDRFWSNVYTYGLAPLPPYIKNSHASFSQYQTVFSDQEGSVAAPTAGLHFTDDLFVHLKQKGIQIEFITLHIGVGTFKPVHVEDIERHRMHHEWFELKAATADRLNLAKAQGKRIIAVGTTTVRVLETCAQESVFQASTGETNLFIYPGYEWKAIDGMMTNFHLPKSTLLMLVAAFMGREKIFSIYKQAIDEGYRFYSFGDAMLIL